MLRTTDHEQCYSRLICTMATGRNIVPNVISSETTFELRMYSWFFVALRSGDLKIVLGYFPGTQGAAAAASMGSNLGRH